MRSENLPIISLNFQRMNERIRRAKRVGGEEAETHSLILRPTETCLTF